MTYQGIVQNGVIVIENGAVLPEGAKVAVAIVTQGGTDGIAESIDPKETIGQKMARLAKKHANRSTNLPCDLAENHDYFLHGAPKRT
jgi:hypothetical protein